MSSDKLPDNHDALAKGAARRAKSGETPINTGSMGSDAAHVVQQNDPRSRPAK